MTIHMIQAAHMDHLGRSPVRIHSASVLVFNLHIIQGRVSACTVRLHCPPTVPCYARTLFDIFFTWKSQHVDFVKHFFIEFTYCI